MAYSADSFVADEQPTTAKWNKLWTNDASFNDGTGIASGAITPEKLLASTGTTWPWTSWTPSWTNLTVGTGGNALNQGYYKQIGKTVFYRLSMIFGTTAPAMGSSPNFVLPVAPQTNYYRSAAGLAANLGYAVLLDTAVTEYAGFVRINSADQTKADLLAVETSSTYARIGNLTAALPFSWGAGDAIAITGCYEAA